MTGATARQGISRKGFCSGEQDLGHRRVAHGSAPPPGARPVSPATQFSPGCLGTRARTQGSPRRSIVVRAPDRAGKLKGGWIQRSSVAGSEQCFNVRQQKKLNTPGQRSREDSGVHPGRSLFFREEAVGVEVTRPPAASSIFRSVGAGFTDPGWGHSSARPLATSNFILTFRPADP